MRKLKEQLDPDFHQFLPEDRPKGVFQYVGHESEHPDTQIILDRILAKEDPETLLKLLNDRSMVETTGEPLKEMFLECILKKAERSYEHVKRLSDIYMVVFS